MRGAQETDTLPAPGPGEVRIRVEAIGLNFADVFTVLGMYDAAPAGVRIIPGLEFSGVVEEIGKGPKKKISKVGRSADGKRNVVVSGDGSESSEDASRYPFRPGDRVMGVTRFGAYASHINIGTSFIRKMPDEWSFQQGAAFVVQALTAWYGLMDLGKGEAGKTVLVHSAAGGVGGFALQVIIPLIRICMCFYVKREVVYRSCYYCTIGGWRRGLFCSAGNRFYMDVYVFCL